MFATFKYLPGQSFIHRLDPRTKLIVFILLTMGTIIIDDIRMMLPLLGLALVYYALARLPWRETWRAWLFVLFFSFVLIGLFSTTLFGTTPSDVQTSHPWFAFPPITLPVIGTVQRVVTYEIALYGVVRALRPLIIMAAVLPFTFTTDPYLYGVAFRRLGLPDGTAFALDLALRYVPTFARDFFVTVDAQRARGYELEAKGAGLFNMIRRAAPLIVPVTINAIAGGEDVTDAMELRAFGVGPRTWSYSGLLKFRGIDSLTIACSVLLVLVLTLLRLFTPYGHYWFPAGWFGG
jgi:energy-coupling factor transport system permease protein